jgi:hypothetical protein
MYKNVFGAPLFSMNVIAKHHAAFFALGGISFAY